MLTIPELRIRTGNAADLADGDYVLYWMIAFRRGRYNFSLDRAVHWAQKLKKPLVILEALRVGYRWASDRIHHFVIQGMADNARHFAKRPVTYYPYLEPTAGAGKGLLQTLAKRACVVVSDDFPCFFVPRMLAAAAQQIPCQFELVDSNGLLPMRAADKCFSRAFDFRRFLQKNLKDHLLDLPADDPLKGARLPRLPELPPTVVRKWPAADVEKLAADQQPLQRFPIDHAVPVSQIAGGTQAAERTWVEFRQRKLPRYAEDRNQPEQDVASGLSPYLHFGHLSIQQVFAELAAQEQWTPDRLSTKTTGESRGWWGMSEPAESFLDEAITWREVGYNFCSQRTDYEQYESLPDWCQATLAKHARDTRPHVYTLPEFEAAATHDPLWNAAQRQLRRDGKMHNYLRMLWGKKVLEWSATPQEALTTLIELNNKYALDGRNPNSYSGIFWCLGRYDRPWAPERPIFGVIRYMSSDNTARKLRVKQYLRDYGPDSGQRSLLD